MKTTMGVWRHFGWVLSGILFMMGCSSQPSQREIEVRRWLLERDKVRVLCTIGMIDDLVDQIGGDHVHSLSLITGQLDPHSYQLVKGDDEKLAVADLIFYNGLGLEHGASLRSYLEQSPKAVNLGAQLSEELPEAILYFGSVPDPHVWMDVSLWVRHVDPVVEALSKVNPEKAEVYRLRGEAVRQKLLSLHEEILQLMSQIPSEGRYLVTSHDAFNYFARAYLADENERKEGTWTSRFMAPEGLAPDGQLSTEDIRRVIAHLEDTHLSIIFYESNVSQDSIRKIMESARSKGIQVKIACCALYADAMGPMGSEGGTYMGMIRHNAQLIHRYLSGEGEDHGE